MDETKGKVDKKHRKLTRAPELSHCDTTSPSVFQLSALSPRSGFGSPSSPTTISASHRNRSSTNVATLKDPSISASPSSLSFSSLLSSSTSFFGHHLQRNENHNINCPDSSNSRATSVTSTEQGRRDDGNTEAIRCSSKECLNPVASSSIPASPCSTAIPVVSNTNATTTLSGTGSCGLEFFRRIPANPNSSSSTNTSHDEHYVPNHNYSNSPEKEGCGREKDTVITPTHKQQQSLLKPVETVSSSASAFSLKRFSSFSFNRGNKAKRNVAKEEHVEKQQSPSTAQNTLNQKGVNAFCSASSLAPSPKPPTLASLSLSNQTLSATTHPVRKTEDGTTVAAPITEARRPKVSTNPFHQYSSSTSTSSSMSMSMSYQLSTDNVTDIIPGCCLKAATPMSTATRAHPNQFLSGEGEAEKHIQSSSSSDGERPKGLAEVTFVCRSCGKDNLVTDLVHEIKSVRLQSNLTPTMTADRSQEQMVPADKKDLCIRTTTVASSPGGVQIKIKRNCFNQLDSLSDHEDNVLADEDIRTFMSGNPFLSDTIKNDEFLKATMRICLVVSPPTSKLQIKSRSLNCLDSLDTTEKGCNNETTVKQNQASPSSSPSSSRPKEGYQLGWTIQPPIETTTPQSNDMLNIQLQDKPTNAPSFPRSPSLGRNNCSQAASPKIDVVKMHSENRNLSPKNTSFFSSRRTNRKPLLVRSEASSSEYFTVRFEGEDDTYISGKRGVPLAYALGSVLQGRNLSFSQITVTDPIAAPGLPIDENTDVGDLVGRRLFVTDNSNHSGEAPPTKTKSSHHQLQKAASVGSATKKLYSSVSTEETLESPSNTLLGSNSGGGAGDSSRIVKQHSKRWSTFLGIKNPHQNQLCELLNQYSKNGVPQFQQGFSCNHHNLAAALDYLSNSHSSWTSFVNCSHMADADTKIQSAIWELVTTEIYYIHALQTVTDLFLACLKSVQIENLLTDVDQNKLFSNIGEICETNLTFWILYLYPMVHHSVTTGHPMCIDFLVTGFTTFSQLFSPYTKYCAEQSTCQYYCRELNRNNCLFTAYLAWCESHKKCNRLRLADILVRPMQRLTKYSLLLTAIRKHVHDDSTAEIMDGMIHSVEHFVCSVNSHLTMRQENERLKGIMARIESYDVVESNNDALDRMVKNHSNMLDLCGPIKGCAVSAGRHLLMEGDLRLKDSQGKIDTHCFLLTDILLICKSIAKRGHGTLKVIRQPYLTDKLKIILKDNNLHCLYLNDWDMAVAAFTLQCPEAKHWYESILKARRIFTTLKQGSQISHDAYSNVYSTPVQDLLGVRNSPRSVGSSHSGSVELNESRNISIDFEKTNSLSSDEGSTHGLQTKLKYSQNTVMANNQSNTNIHTFHLGTNSATTTSPVPGPTKKCKSSLDVKQHSVLRQSLPNLSLHSIQNNNTLLVPGAGLSSQNNLLSPSHRGISYPPPSPTRATLRRAHAITTPTKNPPLEKTRNITSQNSIVGVPVSTPGTALVGTTLNTPGLANSSNPCQALLDEFVASPVRESDV